MKNKKIEVEVEVEKDDYPEFDVPSAIDLTDLGEDEEREIVATIRKKGDGKACLVAIDGVPLVEEEEYEETEEDLVDDELAEEVSFEDRVRNANLI